VNIGKHAVQRGILKHGVDLYLNMEEASIHLTENTPHHYKNRLLLFREITAVRCENAIYTVWVSTKYVTDTNTLISVL
jgi:hypothetical protein